MYVGFTTTTDNALEAHVDAQGMTVTIYDEDKENFQQATIKGEEMEALYWYLGEIFKAKRSVGPERDRRG